VIINDLNEENLINVLKDVCRNVHCTLRIYYKPGLDVRKIIDTLKKITFRVDSVRPFTSKENIEYGDIVVISSLITNINVLYDSLNLEEMFKNIKKPIVFVLK